MLEETPAWTFTFKRPLYRWNEYVHLLPQRIVGYWFCLDRSSSRRLWKRRFARLDHIVGIENGVIIASERSPILASELAGCGVYAISLETGHLLWTHASGLWGKILRALDFSPGWRNLDWPVYVLNGRCYCRSGRVLDIRTGRLLEKVLEEEIKPPQEPESDNMILARSKVPSNPAKLKVGDGLWLSHKLATGPDDLRMCIAPPWMSEFRLFLTDDEGRVRWEFDQKNTGFHIHECRYSAPYVYLLACRKPATTMQTENEINDPRQYHLLTLDVSSGSTVQDIQITRKPGYECRTEDNDDRGILVKEIEEIHRRLLSQSELHGEIDFLLHYFRRRDK